MIETTALLLGLPFDFAAKDIINPATGVAYPDLTVFDGRDLFCSCKDSLDATTAVKTITDTDTARLQFTTTKIGVKLFDHAESKALDEGKTYYLDLWLKDENDEFFPANFGTAAAPEYIVKFTTQKPVSTNPV